MIIPWPNPEIYLKALEAILELAVKYLPKIADAMLTMAKILNGLDPKESAEELGDKALQAEEQDIKPEHYDTYDEYLKAVEDFPTDKVRSEELSTEEKLIKSIGVITMFLQENNPEVNFSKLLEAIKISDANKEFFTVEHFTEFAKLAADDKELLNSLGKLLNGEEMEAGEYLDIVGRLVDIEQKLHPDMTEAQAEAYVKNLG